MSLYSIVSRVGMVRRVAACSVPSYSFLRPQPHPPRPHEWSVRCSSSTSSPPPSSSSLEGGGGDESDKKQPRRYLELTGGPLRMKGSGRSITSEVLVTESYGGEPMRVHCFQGYISSLFAVEYPERQEWMLLDTGMPSDVARVKRYILASEQERRGGAPPSTSSSTNARVADVKAERQERFCRELKLVVSSHCHIDHIGAGYSYAKMGIPVATAKGFEAYYAGFSGKIQEAIDLGLSMVVAFRLGRRFEGQWSMYRPGRSLIPAGQTKPFPPLDDGQSPSLFEDWVALKCPGHTGHMILMYHPLSQILYAADFVVAPRLPRFQAPMPVEIDFAYNHSLHRLRGLAVRYVLLAHGGVVNTEDFGGWNAILDNIVENKNQVITHWGVRAILERLVGFSGEPGAFTQDMLPRGPLPTSGDGPIPDIIRLK